MQNFTEVDAEAHGEADGDIHGRESDSIIFEVNVGVREAVVGSDIDVDDTPLIERAYH